MNTQASDSAGKRNAISAPSELPGPNRRFPIGSFHQFTRNPLQFLLEQGKYGDLSGFYFGPVPIIVVNHPDLVHDVLVTNADKYYKRSASKRRMAPFIGNGLVVSDGAFWKSQRRLMQPAFHSKRINAYAETMVRFADELASEWQDGAARSIDQDMTTLTMRIIAKTLFDADVAQEPPQVTQAGNEAMALLEQNSRQLITLPCWLPTTYNLKLKSVTQRFDALIQKFIDERRASGEDKGDFLSLLLAAQYDDNSTMTNEQVRSEAKTLFAAGHVTTAVTLTWVWYALSQYPEVAAKLHAELDRILVGRVPTIEDLPRLTYTENVVKEAMRFYPPALTITRQVHEDVMLGGRWLKPGQNLLINLYGIHHDERFYPHPEHFDPERFSAENEKSLPKYAYLPFGGGPRVCIGNAFALMESRLLLATLAQRFTLSLVPGFTVVPDREFTLRPKYGMRMIVKGREPRGQK